MQIRQLLREAIDLFKAQGIESARLDAELLMMHVARLNRVQLITHDNEELNPLDETMFRALVDLRVQGHPIAHLLGEREFWNMTLKVTADTLIPRPDTEVLVEKAITLIDCYKFKQVLDLGTGSGAIILALKRSCPFIEASAVDFSEPALIVALQNAIAHKLSVQFYHGSWFDGLKQAVSLSPNLELIKDRTEQVNFNFAFDLIVSNPPYIEEHDPHLSQGDVRFEPITALVSGKDGLEDIRSILKEAPLFLKDNGYLMFEHGYNQGQAVRDLMKEAGFSKIETIRDYGQNERVTLGCKERKA